MYVEVFKFENEKLKVEGLNFYKKFCSKLKLPKWCKNDSDQIRGAVLALLKMEEEW